MDTDTQTHKYEVEVTGSFTTWIEVEAEDEDAAHDKAKHEVRSLGSMNDWTYDGMYDVQSITKVSA